MREWEKWETKFLRFMRILAGKALFYFKIVNFVTMYPPISVSLP